MPTWPGRRTSKPIVAAIYAGQLGHEGAGLQVARAARSAPFGPEPLPQAQLLLRGLAVRLTDGYLAAAPLLKEALRRYRAQPQELDWLGVSSTWSRWTCGTTRRGLSSRPARSGWPARTAP